MESQKEGYGHCVSCGPLLDRMRTSNPFPCLWDYVSERKHLIWHAQYLVRHEEGLPGNRAFAVLQRHVLFPERAGSG